jgi:hypothetical protein
MSKKLVTVAILAAFALAAGSAGAQEVTIHHGFLFFAGEKYTMDEKTYGIYDPSNKLEEVLKENADALSSFHSYQTWHTIANISAGTSFGLIALGLLYQGIYDEVSKDLDLGENGGWLIAGVGGGGLLALSFIFEFIAWGSISSAAETYNKELMDEGPALKLDPVPIPTLAVGPKSAHLALTWRF